MAPRTTQDQWNETHETIMREAKRLFATKGYNGTSMNDIVRASGVSKGAIYNHFDSKENLFMTLLDLETEQGFNQLETLMGAGSSVLDRLITAIKYTFSTSVACPREVCMMQIEFMMTASRIEDINPSLQKRYQSIHGFFVSLLDEAKKKGEIRSNVDSNGIVTLVYAMLDGLAFQHATLGIQYDTEHLESVLMELILKSIRA
jgi:AcrR family transcriptional regulator